MPRATPSTMRGYPLRMYAMEREISKTKTEESKYGRKKNGESDL